MAEPKRGRLSVVPLELHGHPPSRATILRLIAVAELGLRWMDTPEYCVAAMPELAAETSPAEAEFSLFDSRLTLPLVLESLLVLDELRVGQHAVEVTAVQAGGSRQGNCWFRPPGRQSAQGLSRVSSDRTGRGGGRASARTS